MPSEFYCSENFTGPDAMPRRGSRLLNCSVRLLDCTNWSKNQTGSPPEELRGPIADFTTGVSIFETFGQIRLSQLTFPLESSKEL